MGAIRDFMNRLINGTTLTEEVAAPDIGGVRQVVSAQPADGMTPGRLAAILRAAANHDPEAYFELAEDIEERDLHYASVLSTRKRSVAQLPITVKEASDDAQHKEHAEFVQKWIDDGILRAALFDMLDAIGKGISIMEIDWQVRLGKMIPAKLTWRTQRWFMFDRLDGETVLLRDGGLGLPLLPHKFVVHRHKTKSGLTIRSGIARVAAWSWMFKAFTVKDWAMFVQNFGQPLRLGKYGRGATEAEKDVLWRAVSGIAGDCAAIIPVGMDIMFQEVAGKSASTDLYEKRADWLDRQVSKLVLGQTTTTDAVSGGHAVSQEHRLVQEDIERSDALCITSTINEQIIPNLVAFNYGPQDHYPQVRVGRPDELPLSDFADAFAKLGPLGLTAEESFIRDRMGIPTPEAGAALIGGRTPTPAPANLDPEIIPPPKKLPAERTLHQSFQNLFKSAHASGQKVDLVEQMTTRLERDAAGAMAGMLDEVRIALMSATDLRDAAERLSKLELSPDDLAEAMARGMALAHLAGQAALLDDLKDSA